MCLLEYILLLGLMASLVPVFSYVVAFGFCANIIILIRRHRKFQRRAFGEYILGCLAFVFGMLVGAEMAEIIRLFPSAHTFSLGVRVSGIVVMFASGIHVFVFALWAARSVRRESEPTEK